MKIRRTTRFVFFVYLLILIWIVLFKMSFSLADLPRYRVLDLDPFHDALNHPIRTKEVISNVIIFIPFGILISMLKCKKGVLAKIIPIFLTSLSFEALQYVFSIGSTDINDLITNTVGGIVGIIIFWIFKKIFRKNAEKLIITLALIILVLIIFFVIAIYIFRG